MVSSHPLLPPRQGGTTKEYAIRKLKRDRPDLLARVSVGELSCHAAMKEAGFRKDPTPLQVVLRLLPKLDAHDLEATIRAARDRLPHAE